MALTKTLYKRIFLLSAILVVVELIYIAARREFVQIDAGFLLGIELVLTLIVTLLASTVILRLTGNKVWTMFEKEMELEQRIIISKLYAISLYSLAIIITVWKAGLSLGNITLFVGLLASGFAFAIRDILLSFFAWFIILNKKPFHMGDYIKIGDDVGLVTRIGTFFFTLEQGRKPEYIKVPNSIVLSKSLQNLGEGKFVQELLFTLKAIPPFYENECQEITNYIKSRSAYQHLIRIGLVSELNAIQLKVEYTTSFEQEHLKSAITAFVCQRLEDSLKFGNQH
jgi:small-conductance mechanosensitive channel